ncbi:MAG: aldehyde dehydrogenase family protein [Chitinophagaceae bacterium]|nr:aldehyde dehydrogenase family protein [Chitinophagaceae bacterium]
MRQIGEELRKYKEDLGKLVSYEMGESLQEGMGEVQEMIDVYDFAVGPRPAVAWPHHAKRKAGPPVYEQYHPLGIIGIIALLIFPWQYGAGTVCWPGFCGNAYAFETQPTNQLCAIACKYYSVGAQKNNVPEGVSGIISGARKWRMDGADTRIALFLQPGSTAMGKAVGATVLKAGRKPAGT